METTGSIDIALQVFKDFEYTAMSTTTAYKLQPPDASLKAVFGPTEYPVTKETAIWDESKWQGGSVVPLRFSVAVQSCAWFAFGFTTSSDVTFIGYEIEFVAKGTRVIAGHRVS